MPRSVVRAAMINWEIFSAACHWASVGAIHAGSLICPPTPSLRLRASFQSLHGHGRGWVQFQGSLEVARRHVALAQAKVGETEVYIRFRNIRIESLRTLEVADGIQVSAILSRDDAEIIQRKQAVGVLLECRLKTLPCLVPSAGL